MAIKIYENIIWRDGQKVGWIDGNHVRLESGNKLGYFENNMIYNMEGHKIASIVENNLRFEEGNPPIPLETVNAEIEGTFPLLTKCAVHVLMEG
jgi:hypothetical protein